MSVLNTPAHDQQQVIKLAIHYPSHAPREADPNYRAFHATRERMLGAGLLKCWITNNECAGGIELHHDKVEYSLINDVDQAAFEAAYGLHLTGADFETYLESEGNLLALCMNHHRGILGIHVLPYPLWVVQRYLKQGITSPAHALKGA